MSYSPRTFNKFIKLAKSLGIKTTLYSSVKRPTYDGESILVLSNLSNFIHEIAHWLVAPEERRGLINYGLSPDPDTGLGPKNTVPFEDEEEALASVLGILIERQYKLPWTLSYRNHNWTTFGGGKRRKYRGLQVSESFSEQVETLIEKGLLTENLELNYFPRN